MAAQKAAIQMAPQKFRTAVQNSHPLKTGGKIVTGVVAGATLGTIGTAITATTGEGDNEVKIAGGAAATAYAVASSRAKNSKTPMDNPTAKAIYDNTYNKGEYKQDAINDYIENFQKDQKTRNWFETKVGKEEAQKMYDNGEIEEYLRNNIGDVKEMAAMHKMQKERIVKDREQAMAIAKLSKMVGSNPDDMTTKKRQEWETKFGEMSGIKEEKARKEFAQQRLSEVSKFYDYKQ